MKNLQLIIIIATFIGISACSNEPKTVAAKESITSTSPIKKEVKPDAINAPDYEIPKEALPDADAVKELEMPTNKKEVVAEKAPTAAPPVAKAKTKAISEKQAKVKDAAVAEKPKRKFPTENVSSVDDPIPVPQPSLDDNTEFVEAPPKVELLPEPEIKESEPVMEFDHTHKAWNDLLSKHVSSSGKVNYSGFKNDIKKLDAYINSFVTYPIKSTWRDETQIAYWINLYNAATVKLIVDNYPVASIMDLHGGKPWDHKWIKVGKKTYSLNNIEHDILRPTFKDARIHFAVNCAAKSCPPLLNKAWTKSNLGSNFDRQAKSFINNTKVNTISADAIEVSKIFDWYGEDFGNLIDYLNKYSETKIGARAEVKFKEYDWKLNN